MEITTEMLDKQAETFNVHNEGIKTGYLSALQWVKQVLETKPPKEDKKDGK
jgi:hypothetical protein